MTESLVNDITITCPDGTKREPTQEEQKGVIDHCLDLDQAIANYRATEQETRRLFTEWVKKHPCFA